MPHRPSASLALPLGLLVILSVTPALSASPWKQAQPIRTALPWTVAPTVGRSAHPLPRDAPRVLVHAPAHLNVEEPIGLVLFFHGWSGCVRVLALGGEVGCRAGERARHGWGLVAAHDAAQTNTIFIVPQLLWLQRSGRAGRFTRPGFAREWLSAIIRDHIAPRLARPHLRDIRDFGPITVLAHSAGFESALAALTHGNLSPSADRVILFDALYSGVEEFLDWTYDDERRRLLSVHGSGGAPRRNTRRLLRRSAERVGRQAPSPSSEGRVPDLRRGAIHAMQTDVPHADIPGALMAQVVREAAESRSGL